MDKRVCEIPDVHSRQPAPGNENGAIKEWFKRIGAERTIYDRLFRPGFSIWRGL
ncbi:hypothetical protein D3C83_264500 [compost metagenome]